VSRRTDRTTEFPSALAAIIILTAVSLANSAELPKGATLLDPDIVWDLEPDPDPSSGTRDPSFAISPDDRSIAYISNGAVWTCSFTAGPARKLAELPNTITAVLATPENRNAWADMKNAQPWASRHMLVSKLPRPPVGVHSLSWTPNQDGVVFTLSEGQPVRPWRVVYRVNFISNDGVVTPITKFERNAYDQPNHFTCFQLTRDKKRIIASNGYTPMIWVAATNKPGATSFDVLIPSSTSGRFLGIEIDTRQLVIADEDFHITKRFDVTFNAQRFCDLIWSRDERYALCRERMEHPSNEWGGFRIDLQKGEQRPMSGTDISEEWLFTGNGGELIRVPPRYGPVTGMKYISLIPDGAEPAHEIFPWPILPPRTFPSKFGRYPAASVSRDGRLFALAFPREGRVPGYQFFLVDREGHKSDFAPNDASMHVSPYNVIAIANGGKTIVACDESRLFSIPIEKIKNANSPTE
jgi:hypothetical protein